ncbi:hypothetical protein TGAM01_v209750 [Trichoderma gamsii]|uniref:Uncharacterized protein n=1 Tax=Trichoderma gamsii TaxID=398673 RepID=A0A2P4ZAX2_9HYPO|nr:hypothetical protein TGAM01_v209750 [Trichoderma gamsii]PON21449.1 hypothetical protein TGAM01_v209750 [Trichoderma gamsii]
MNSTKCLCPLHPKWRIHDVDSSGASPTGLSIGSRVAP